MVVDHTLCKHAATPLIGLSVRVTKWFSNAKQNYTEIQLDYIIVYYDVEQYSLVGDDF